jgi:Uma2 family endonuclease
MITTTATKNRSSTLLIYPPEPLEIDFGNLLIPMDDDDFFYFCQRHRDLRIEMDQFEEITIMSPTGSETGRINFALILLWKSALSPIRSNICKPKWRNISKTALRWVG